jgi:hypothetical protein
MGIVLTFKIETFLCYKLPIWRQRISLRIHFENKHRTLLLQAYNSRLLSSQNIIRNRLILTII